MYAIKEESGEHYAKCNTPATEEILLDVTYVRIF